MKVIKFVMVILVCGLAYYAFHAGKDYAERVVQEKDKKIESMKKDVSENDKEVYCNNLIISRINGWSVHSIDNNDYFIREDKYIDISNCANMNLTNVPLFKF